MEPQRPQAQVRLVGEEELQPRLRQLEIKANRLKTIEIHGILKEIGHKTGISQAFSSVVQAFFKAFQ